MKWELHRAERFSRSPNLCQRPLKRLRFGLAEDQLIQRLVRGLDGGPAIEELGGPIPELDAALGIKPLHGDVWGVLDGGSQALLAIAQRFIGAVFGNADRRRVCRHGDQTQMPIVGQSWSTKINGERTQHVALFVEE